MIATLPERLLRIESPPMADWLEGFVPMKMHVLIRFGKWREIIDVPLPHDQALFCTTTAMMHYAKAVAHAATGNVSAAEKEASLFGAAVERVPPTRYLFNNTCLDILAVAAAMMNGEIAYRKGRFEEAFAHLRRSVALDDGLPYDHAGAYRSHQPMGPILPSTTWQAPAPIIPMEPSMHSHAGAPASRNVELAHVAHTHPAGIIPVVHSRLAGFGFGSRRNQHQRYPGGNREHCHSFEPGSA